MAGRLRQDLAATGAETTVVDRFAARSVDRIDSSSGAILCSIVDEGLKLTGDAEHDYLERQMAVQSVGAVLQSLFLIAAERGVASCWMAAPMYCPEAVCDCLDLPGTFRPQALVLMGYAAGEHPARPRLPLSAIVTRR